VSPERPRLHVPSEPVAQRAAWYEAVLGGQELAEVVADESGIAAWFWERWRVLARVGLDRVAFGKIVDAYRREIWLWLAGERTWEQCCSGLLGRLERRLPE
jgi:hypothetical protein